jgi:hypothetical protein
VLWDGDDEHVFAALSSRGTLHTYLLTQQSLSGPGLELLGSVVLPSGHTPVVLSGGRLFVRLKSGVLDSWLLDTHKALLDQDCSGAKALTKLCAGDAGNVVASVCMRPRVSSSPGCCPSSCAGTACPVAASHPTRRRLAAAIKLNQLQAATAAARALDTADGWHQLAAAAVQQLDVRLAIAAYRQVWGGRMRGR